MDQEIAQALGALRVRVDAAAHAQAELDEQVVAAREAGATFPELATALGLNSPQAAQHNYRAAVRRLGQRRES